MENAADEAVAVKELIGSSKRLILVTSGYHMYRAKLLFEKKEIEVIPYKVDYKVERNKEMVIMDFLPDAESLKRTETGIREFMGRLIYF